MNKTYAGIGSRETPLTVCSLFSEIASLLEEHGYILYSGGADGADKAFENGVKKDSNKVIFKAWQATKESMNLASTVHPAWHNCSEGAQKLHGRNCFQVLGEDLKTPVDFVLCWTQKGKAVGGTATAINLAKLNNIPIFNFYETEYTLKEFTNFLESIEGRCP